MLPHFKNRLGMLWITFLNYTTDTYETRFQNIIYKIISSDYEIPDTEIYIHFNLNLEQNKNVCSATIKHYSVINCNTQNYIIILMYTIINGSDLNKINYYYKKKYYFYI